MLGLTDADRARIGEAITAAELNSDGEIVAAATPKSDAYHDVALHWAVATLIAVLAWFAAFPATLDWYDELLFGGWREVPGPHELLTLLMVIAVAKFTVVLLVLRIPAAAAGTDSGRNQTAAGAAARDHGVQGGGRAADDRADGRADLSVARRTPRRDRRRRGAAQADVGGCLGRGDGGAGNELRAGRPADGLVAAIGLVGEVLAKHFPKTDGDTNEIPDRLVEL